MLSLETPQFKGKNRSFTGETHMHTLSNCGIERCFKRPIDVSGYKDNYLEYIGRSC